MPPALKISVDGRPTDPKIGPHERLRGVCPWWDSIIAKQYVLTNQARADLLPLFPRKPTFTR